MVNEELNEKLRKKFSPIGSSLYKHQRRLLEILEYIDSICRTNGISYWLSSGTALGAVRHGGFIPWDDDIDIEMTFKDYLRFETIVLEDDKYDIQTRKTDMFYAAPYSKLRDRRSLIDEHPQDGNYKFKGIYVDVFIIEKNPSLLISAFFSRLIWRLIIQGGESHSNMQKKRFILKKKIIYSIRSIVRLVLISLPSQKYRHTLGGGFNRNVRYLNEIFPLKEIAFEGHLFTIANDYDSYLKRIYGDYMTLPDVSSIHPHISNVSFD